MGSHFYCSDGTCIEGLRAARKLDPLPLPSPTTVLSLLMSPGLVYYFKRQMFEAAVTTPRLPGQSDDEFWDACCAFADEHGKAARDRGGELHDLIQQFHMAVKHGAPPPVVPTQLAPQYGTYVDWYADNVAKSLAVEEVVVGAGFAGRVDHVCQLRDGRWAVCDAKSQALKGKRSFNKYTGHVLQLGAYADAWAYGQSDTGRCVDVLMSIYISSDSGPAVLEAYEWPEPPHHYAQLFKGLLAVWSLENSYYPTRAVEEVVA